MREHLEKILASRTLAGSKRTQDFLRLVVTHTLGGETDSLRERMIGAELFGRPVGYDTGNDSVVRVRANDARKKLAKYYRGEAKDEKLAVRIELPSGSYIPKFNFETAEPKQKAEDATPTAAAAISAGLPRGGPARTSTSRSLRRAAAAEKTATPWARVALLVAAVCVLAVIVIFAVMHKRLASPAPPKGIHSIAVLPFDNLSGVSTQDYFADGLTEELINDLGQVSTLRIISFTSSMSFKGTQKTLPEIAKELSVDGVVEGGVLRDGNQVRISVQLIDASTDRPVWASTYVQDITSVFAWQGEVAQAIAEEISTKVTPQEEARLGRKEAVDPDAQDLYLHGLLQRNAGDCGRAIDDFQQAIAKSPDYAKAHSALATCYGMLGESGQMPYKEAFEQQKAEALKAIALEDSFSEAHAELGNTAMTMDWNWPAADAEFREAISLNPSSATNHEKYAFYLVRTGHSNEAFAQIEQSVDLDPVSGSTFHAEGFIYYFAHRYNRALSVARTAEGLNINLPDWNFLLGDIYAAKGMYAESIKAFKKSGDGPYSLGHLGNVYARAGQTDAAHKVIQRLENDVKADGVGRYEIALVYAGLGEKDPTFRWLEEAYHAHDVGMVYLKVDPCLDPLRSDPRFANLLRLTGLQQ
ncbi:MAG: tetratricopeptide repeat protein [Terracidiphilus sp.]